MDAKRLADLRDRWLEQARSFEKAFVEQHDSKIQFWHWIYLATCEVLTDCAGQLNEEIELAHSQPDRQDAVWALTGPGRRGSPRAAWS